MCNPVPCAHILSVIRAIRLYLQHGSQRGSRHHSKYLMDWIQYHALQKDRQFVGSLAGSNCCMDHTGNEP